MPVDPRELGVIKVAKPCDQSWDDMTGDARARFCASCQLNVYNLSEMTSDEAHALIREKEGKLCVRFFQRDDGTVLTRDCPVGVARYRRRLVVAGVSAVSVSLLGLTVAVTRAFDEAPAETCSQLQPIPHATEAGEVSTPDAPVLQVPPETPKASGDAWIDQRRNQLGPRAAPPQRHVMGKMMSIQVIKGKAED